jgi:hypothetical protein
LKRLESTIKDQISLRDLLEKLGSLKPDLDDPSIQSTIKSAETKAKQIRNFVNTDFKAFSEELIAQNLVGRISLWQKSSQCLPPSPDKRIRSFCHGALRVQSDWRSQEILIPEGVKSEVSRSKRGSLCKYCNLQVGNTSPSKKPGVKDPIRFLAASHITACAPFDANDAFYKCLFCYMEHQDKDFGTAKAYLLHVKSEHTNCDMETLKASNPQSSPPESTRMQSQEPAAEAETVVNAAQDLQTPPANEHQSTHDESPPSDNDDSEEENDEGKDDDDDDSKEEEDEVNDDGEDEADDAEYDSEQPEAEQDEEEQEEDHQSGEDDASIANRAPTPPIPVIVPRRNRGMRDLFRNS